MKFGKQLRETVDESCAEWRGKYMSYKKLKKCLHACQLTDDVVESRLVTDCSSSFLEHLQIELDKVNDFFLDKQEDLIIEHERATSGYTSVAHWHQPVTLATRARLNRARERLTNLHGQLVLLDHFSMINYVAFCKILKKHDKKGCGQIRSSCLSSVLQTPIFLSNVVRTLIFSIQTQLITVPTTIQLAYLRPLPPQASSVGSSVEPASDSETSYMYIE